MRRGHRSAAEIRAAQAACSGPGEPAGAAVAGDGRRFEIRCRRQQSLAALVTSLNSGDLSGAQQAYSSLSELQRFANPNKPFGQAMSQIGQAFQNGDFARGPAGPVIAAACAGRQSTRKP